jgi:uncharacterized protein DUF6011
MEEFPHQLYAETETRAGRMFSAGDVRVTVTMSPQRGGDHITVRFKAIKDNREGDGRNWLRVPLNEATHVFIEVPTSSGDWPDKIGVFYPRTGKFFEDSNADPDRIQAAVLAARWLNEGESRKSRMDGFRFQEESYCGICGRTLTDPESIDRGIGPECFGKQTDSHHQQKQKMSAVAEGGIKKMTAERIIELILDLPEEDVDHIRQELNMWASAERQSSLFEGR